MEELVIVLSLEFARLRLLSIFKPAVVAFVYRVIENDDAALLQQLAQRAIRTKKFNRIELSSPPPYGGFRWPVQMDQSECTFPRNDDASAVQRTNLPVGKHGTQRLRGGITKGRVEYSERTNVSKD